MSQTSANDHGEKHNPLEALKERLPDIPMASHSIVDKVTSQLGRNNPFAHPVDPETGIVWLFDNTAYHPSDRSSKWAAEVIAAYFVRRSGDEGSRIVAQVARAIGLADDAEAKKTITERLSPLLNQILPARTSVINIADKKRYALPPSGPDGICRETLTLPDGDWRDGQTVQTEVQGGVEHVGSVTTFAKAEGFGIISDVDDTIKVTLTNTALGIVKTTFVEEPKIVQGMPELYKHLSEVFQKPPFWYLTASPYNLYPFLRKFRNANYPPGTMLMRNASWMNLAGFVSSLSQGTEKYKLEHLESLHKTFPQRQMICIGDSTQTDPEAYGEAYRKYQGWIKAIWIRKVEDVKEITDVIPGQDSEARNKSKRFEEAFRDVPKEVWHVFEDPQELYAKVESLKSK